MRIAVSDDHARCPIWGYVVMSAEVGDGGAMTVCGSVGADGDYRVSADAIDAVQALEDDEKARLTYRLVKGTTAGNRSTGRGQATRGARSYIGGDAGFLSEM